MWFLSFYLVVIPPDIKSPDPGEDRRLHDAQVRVVRVVQNDIRT